MANLARPDEMVSLLGILNLCELSSVYKLETQHIFDIFSRKTSDIIRVDLVRIGSYGGCKISSSGSGWEHFD